MASIDILNKATKNKPGGGLAFYDNINNVFGNSGDNFNDGLGLWSVPPDKVPTFQLFIEAQYDTIVNFNYINSSGVFSVPFSALSQTNVKINNINYIVYETSDVTTLAPTPAEGVYYIQLTFLNVGTGARINIFSDYFNVKNCC
jgi:hypothetical protein